MNYRSDDYMGRRELSQKGRGSGKSDERRSGLWFSNGGEAVHPLCGRGCALDRDSQIPSSDLVPSAFHSSSRRRHRRWLVDDLGPDEEKGREQVAYAKDVRNG